MSSAPCEGVEDFGGVRAAHQDGHRRVPIAVLVVPPQLGEGASFGIDAGQLGAGQGGQPFAGRTDPQSAAGRFQPHRLLGLAGQPQPPPGSDHALQQQVQTRVQALRMEGASGIELDQVDRAPRIQRWLSGQQRTVRIVAFAPPRVAEQVVQGVLDAVGAHAECARAVTVGAARRPRTGRARLSTATSANSACPTTTWAWVRPSSSSASPSAWPSHTDESTQVTTAAIDTSRAAGPSTYPGATRIRTWLMAKQIGSGSSQGARCTTTRSMSSRRCS